jgi:hypothetical protein
MTERGNNMNGKLRHIERRKAAKEKEKEKWGLTLAYERKVERAVEVIEYLRDKGVDIVAALEAKGIDANDGVNYGEGRLFAALEEMLTEYDKEK